MMRMLTMLTMTTMTTTKKNEKETTIDDDDEDPRDRLMPIRSSESGMGLGRSTGARESLIGTRGQRGTICSLSVSGYREAGSLTRRECTVDSELREQVIGTPSPAEVRAIIVAFTRTFRMSRAPVPPAPVTRLMVKLMGGMLLRPQVSDISNEIS